MTIDWPTKPGPARIPQFTAGDRPGSVGECRVGETVVLADGSVGAIRVEDFFADAAAQALHAFLCRAVVYERDDIGVTKRASRGARDGELPDDPLLTSAGAVNDGTRRDAEAAMAVFSSAWFVENLSSWLDVPLEVLRPSTPYRLAPQDFISPHDDYPAPEFRLSVAANLTLDAGADDGGETFVGLVDRVEEYDWDDFFFPLKRWTLRSGERTLRPRFNSLLLIPLSGEHAHGVRAITGGHRYSITTLYGDCLKRR